MGTWDGLLDPSGDELVAQRTQPDRLRHNGPVGVRSNGGTHPTGSLGDNYVPGSPPEGGRASLRVSQDQPDRGDVDSRDAGGELATRLALPSSNPLGNK